MTKARQEIKPEEFPLAVHGIAKGTTKLVSKIVRSQDEYEEAIKAGWRRNILDDLGVETHPQKAPEKIAGTDSAPDPELEPPALVKEVAEAEKEAEQRIAEEDQSPETEEKHSRRGKHHG